ncbi:hypothetical protein [Variovorax guangxiensis]|uniref:hypothetical protein n=1 Tax=Variovorax guangxiensis TaxID=1775474 RepID=UPI001128507B|nr:hypothetical protein [Variovorax guangxiensis]
MTMRTVPDLKELFKQASEIAQQVPANMQEAAFNRALELLTAGSLGKGPDADIASAAPVRTAVRSKTSGKGASAVLPNTDAVGTLLRGINSTQHPGVASAATGLDRALMILKIALDEHNIDGLAPSDIAKVLRDKFRVSAPDSAIRMALTRAAKLVDRVPNGSGFLYRIMAPGEGHLASLTNSNPTRDALGAVSPLRKKARRVGKIGASSPVPERDKVSPAGKKAGRPAAAAKRTSGQLGPKAAVLGLIADKFFDAPKTGQAVQAHLKTRRGFTIGADQLRLALLRLVREQALDREENADGDYEYKRR